MYKIWRCELYMKSESLFKGHLIFFLVCWTEWSYAYLGSFILFCVFVKGSRFQVGLQLGCEMLWFELRKGVPSFRLIHREVQVGFWLLLALPAGSQWAGQSYTAVHRGSESWRGHWSGRLENYHGLSKPSHCSRPGLRTVTEKRKILHREVLETKGLSVTDT